MRAVADALGAKGVGPAARSPFRLRRANRSSLRRSSCGTRPLRGLRQSSLTASSLLVAALDARRRASGSRAHTLQLVFRVKGSSVAYKILVADDEKDIRSVLALYLEDAGFEVVEAADGAEALRVLEEQDIDLCLLDIMMPELDGYQVLKRVREDDDVPVIVVSAKGQDSEKILGLNLGADDYLVKPFNPLEAVARVNSNIRRAKGIMPQQRAAAPLVCRDLELDRESCTLTRDGQPIALTSAEYRIMCMLMEHPGRVFTKQQIYECGWDEDYIAAENSVMVCMSKLRAKLGGDPQDYIKTIRGLGYRLER